MWTKTIKRILLVSLFALPVAAMAGTMPKLSSTKNSAKSKKTKAKAPPKIQSPVPKFKQADTNHNGKISLKEAEAAGVSKKLFKRDDFNHNGFLNKTEWMFVRLDKAHFGKAAKGNSPGNGNGDLD